MKHVQLRGLLLAVVFIVTSCGSENNAGSVGAAPDAIVRVNANGCPSVLPAGTGVWVGAHLILTAAHVVAGAQRIDVVDSVGRVMTAQPLAFDPQQDVALLRVHPTTQVRRAVRFVKRLTTGPASVGLLNRSSGAGLVVPVRVLRNVLVNTTDIYDDARVSRPGYEIAAEIQPGDSGAPLLVGGDVVGLVWARSVAHQGRAWVVSIPQDVAELMESGTDSAPIVSAGHCR